MLNQRLAVVRAVTTGLVGVESNIDDALIGHGMLQAELIRGRKAANLPLTAGVEGLEHLQEAGMHLAAARKAMAKAHYALREVRDGFRLPIHAYGDTGDSPDEQPKVRSADAEPLKLVSAA